MFFSLLAAVAAAQPGQPGYLTYRTIPLATANAIGVGVDVASGNLRVTEQDLAPSAASYQVEVNRTYNSQAAVPGVADGALGPRWTFDVGVQTRVAYAGSTAAVYGPDGYVQQLTQAPNGTYVGPSGYDGVLTRNGDGTSTLAQAADTLHFATSGQLSSVTNAHGTFTVQDTSAGGHTVLSSYGTGGGQRANFSYIGTPRVHQLQDPASLTHEYFYDSSNRLAEIKQPDGSSVAYHYDSNGYLSELISKPDGTIVTFSVSSTGQVSSLTVTTLGGGPATTTFSYKSGSTTVTEPSGVEVVYSYGSTGRVTSVTSPNAAGPDAFTCVTSTPDEPGFVNPEVEESGDIGLAPEASVCPPGQQQEATGFEERHEAPPVQFPEEGNGQTTTLFSAEAAPSSSAATPSDAPANLFYHLGALKIFSGLYPNGKAIQGSPTRGAKASITIAQPVVPIDPGAPSTGNHSLAEIAVQSQEFQANDDQIEVGWIVAPIAGRGLKGARRPQLFVFAWVNGSPRRFNGGNCKPFGNGERRVRKGAFLTASATPRRFGVLHDAAMNRWEIYYAGHPVCAYPDSLWSGSFVSARTVQWFGEVTRYSNGLFCPQMGNGTFGTKSGAARFSGIAGAGGGPGTPFYRVRGTPADPNYNLESIGSDGFTYGGPGDGC